MTEERFILDVIEEANAKRRVERRRFMRAAGGAAIAAGGLSLLAACDDDDDDAPTPVPTAAPTTGVSEADVLNFALQLEYLEANFYSYAAFGTPINAALTAGIGTQGSVQLPSTEAGRPRPVQFQDQVIAQYAREIAYDEIAHVTFLRRQLGAAAAAQPTINISGDATGSFTAAARASNVVGNTATFDPYLNENNFLLGAYLFEDVGVTAYMGGVQLLSTPAFIEAAAGIHAAEAYHAGLVRTVLYARGVSTQSLITAAGQISAARDTLDGTINSGLLDQRGSRDQGLTLTNAAGVTSANLVPTDANGIAFVRSPSQVLNIVYLNGAAGTSSGGFFPAGVNGAVRTTVANT
ncbi:ferritin-like domain-containing protein [Sphingomonas sp. CFBP 8760]|uniref:ferritin-like domain-containing protein n=1 Tax=Sphingomonas sp. CFBP 8760 TaxID=2775282 RepID=UPI00178731D5|nr:ferritin-like domain-containing protein [Sphingomonas sp. CFBP 8760]MBD8546630.1 ferritin-like domain-containing protein [Sphingomonas sp. CFBP 8760]